MRAVAVIPGKPDSIHLREVPTPRVDEVPDGRGVLVRVLRVGVDGTDREINAAEYGTAPPGDDYLILGHESLGVVESVGPRVFEVALGDLVVATVRRPGTSLYDRFGYQDLTTDDVYFERGINLRHGYLAEFYVDGADHLVKLPPAAREVGVLLEPMSIAEKGIVQAFDIQRRLKVWRPRKAAVMGAGTLGLLATMALRLRGLEVTTFGREEPPTLNASLVDVLGARYVSTKQTSITDAGRQHGPFDLIFEGTGNAGVVFEAAGVLAKNGVQILTSITGGGRKLEIPVGGYDPVAHFDAGKAIEGSKDFTFEWQDATWRFATAAHRDAFAKEPARYAPRYGGYCAWAVGHGYTAPGDPEAWTIVDGKLYLNYNAEVKAKWTPDASSWIEKGDTNWPKLVSGGEASADAP